MYISNRLFEDNMLNNDFCFNVVYFPKHKNKYNKYNKNDWENYKSN